MVRTQPAGGQYTLRNTVMVHVPKGTDPKAAFDRVADSLGIAPGLPDQAALRVMLDRKVAAVFKPTLTDGGRVPTDKEITALWADLKKTWGFGPEDIEWETDPWDGRPVPLLPKRVAEAIAKKTKTNWFIHNLGSKDWVGDALADAAEGGRPFALVSTERRFANGVMEGGMSSWEDLDSGGGEYVFTRQRRDPIDDGVNLDAARMLRRLDWFAYPGDRYGVRNPDDSYTWPVALKHERNLDALPENRRAGAETMFKGVITLGPDDYLEMNRWSVKDIVAGLQRSGRWSPAVEALMRRVIRVQGEPGPYTGPLPP